MTDPGTSQQNQDLQSCPNDSGIMNDSSIYCAEDSEEDSNDIVDKLRVLHEQLENSIEESRARDCNITTSPTFEKDFSIEFTKNFLILWGFEEYVALFTEKNIDKKSFLSLTETSSIFKNISKMQDVKKILKKKSTLLKYLQEPSYKISQAIYGSTLRHYLEEEQEKKAWLDTDNTTGFAADLCKYITDNILTTQLKRATIEPYEFRFWANEICRLWPLKNDVWRWYKPYIFNGSLRKCQGKLYETYKRRTEKHRKLCKKIDDTENAKLENEEREENNVMMEKLSSIYNSQTIGENFLKIWNETVQYRRKKKLSITDLSIQGNIFKEVDHVKILIQMDFNFITRKKLTSNYLSNVWRELAIAIIYSIASTSHIVRDIRDKFNSCPNKDDELKKNFAWQLLPFYMAPPANCNNEKKRFKASKLEGAGSFIRWINNDAELCISTKDHRKEMEKAKVPIRPYVIAIQNKNVVSSAYVIVNNTSYKCETLTDAIDMAFKFYVINQQEYCKLSRCLWSFIERYLYKLNITGYQQLHTVNEFIHKLELELSNP